MLLTADALIIRVVSGGDHDRILTALTRDLGRITILAKGGRSVHSNQLALCQPYVYANLELYQKGDMYWLRGGTATCRFYHVTADLDSLNLATYLCDVAYDVSGEGVSCETLLRLLLNTLYALDAGKKDTRLVKAAFEWRVAVEEGYEPDLSGCAVCGRTESELMYLNVMNGNLTCPDCLRTFSVTQAQLDAEEGVRSVIVPLHENARLSFAYLAHADLSKLLSFNLPEPDLCELSHAAETYLLNHLERGFDSLDFYKSMLAAAQPLKKDE